MACRSKRGGLNRSTPTRPKQSAQEKAATTSFTASAYWKFESSPLQGRVREPSVPLAPEPEVRVVRRLARSHDEPLVPAGLPDPLGAAPPFRARVHHHSSGHSGSRPSPLEFRWHGATPRQRPPGFGAHGMGTRGSNRLCSSRESTNFRFLSIPPAADPRRLGVTACHE